MIEPLKIVYVVGKTRFNQTVNLIREKQNDGVSSWTIQKLAINQRDETDTIVGLDDETILNMAQAVNNHRGR